jgi:hypothetical protein
MAAYETLARDGGHDMAELRLLHLIKANESKNRPSPGRMA